MTCRQWRNLALATAAFGFAAAYGLAAWSLAGDSFTAAEEEASKGQRTPLPQPPDNRGDSFRPVVVGWITTPRCAP